MINLIGLSGYINSGKSTIGGIIQGLTSPNSTIPKWEIKGFSVKLKEIASILTGIPAYKFEDQEFKKSKLGKEWDDSYGIDTVRELLQVLGTDTMREMVHPDIWVNALFSDYKYTKKEGGYARVVKSAGGIPIDYEYEVEYPNWIITDVRFSNEAKAIKNRGGIVIRINRGDVVEELSNGNVRAFPEKHPSETALHDYKFDYVLHNNGTIEELIESVREMLIKYEII